MIPFVLRRLAVIPLALVLVNCLGFSYAFLAQGARAARDPYQAAGERPPLLPAYGDYLHGVARLDFGILPRRVGQDTVLGTVARSGLASLGLIVIAGTLSVAAGVGLGLRSVRAEPPRASPWLTTLATTGLAMPSFFAGSLMLTAAVAFLIWGPDVPLPIPLGGYGWDAHLVLPVLVLMVRPTAQIAQVTAGLLVDELGKQYVVAARSAGHSWRSIFRRYALRNILPPVFVTIGGSLRLLVGELILVEWLFNWPGLGRLVAQTLVPAHLTSAAESLQFLNPPLLAAALSLIAAFFLLVDFAASTCAAAVDPRLRATS
jgi:ABC-type dipeptide/oligopeptide/nickel transport system permease component